MLRNLTLLFLLIAGNTLHVSAQSFWQTISESSILNNNLNRQIIPDKYETASLDVSALTSHLTAAPMEQFSTDFTSNIEIDLPLPDGTTERFRVWKSPVMHPDLAARYPRIQTFAGRSIENPATKVRFDITPHGFHALISGGGRTIYIDPYAKGITEHYVVYHKKDFSTTKEFHCALDEVDQGDLETDDTDVNTPRDKEENFQKAATYCTEAVTLRTYRTAVACTGEFGEFHGGTVELALAAVVTTMNRVNSVYENDLAIRMELIPNNDDIIYTNGLLDPFVGNDQATVLLVESQVQIDLMIGSANYDVGHTVSTGAGGVAFLGVICTNQKAGGITGTRNPVGDPFDIDYVSHEIGHQFGGNHTFNGSQGSCGGNGGSNVALEPGSGSTIQAYAGICGDQNLQPNSDPYFHSASLQEMGTYSRIRDGNTCPVQTATTNTSPVIVSATSGITIPASTPFEMTAEAIDPDGDELTYCWEQYDLGPSNTIDDPNAVNGPIFRSFNPTLSPVRTFPRLTDLVNNTTAIGEVLPAVSRTLEFRLTVRDNGTNSNNIGGLCYDNFAISVDASAGPMLVTYPNEEGNTLVWQGGTQETVTWDVANTDAAPVNCQMVDIMLSRDGGLTYPITLATGVPNNGSATVDIPNDIESSQRARVKVKAADNIFFDITNENFILETLIQESLPLQWLSFTATAIENAIQLQWQTAEEQSNNGFEVERRSVEKAFTSISFVNAKTEGNSNSYSLVDEDVKPNTLYYYRLRQVDNDGQSTHSNIIIGQLEGDTEDGVVLTPNPTQDVLNVAFANALKSTGTLEIYTVDGSLQQREVLQNAQSEINVNHLAAGIYVVKMKIGEEQIIRRLVKK